MTGTVAARSASMRARMVRCELLLMTFHLALLRWGAASVPLDILLTLDDVTLAVLALV